MKPNFFNLAKAGFLSALFFILLNTFLLVSNLAEATGKIYDQTPVSSSKTIFDSVLRLPPPQRINSAVRIYKAKCRKIPVAAAMHNLDDLNKLALQLNDKSLQCAVFWLRADYYSVNRSFNPLSLRLYQEAIDFAKNNSLPVETAISIHKMGMFYSTFKRIAAAYPYLLDAQELFRSIGFSNVPGISTYLNDLALFYYNIGDYYNAKIKLTEALKYKTYTKRDEISMINSIGLIYRMYRQYDRAIAYFNKSLQLAKLSRDSAWIGIAQGNIGSAYLMQNKFNQALPYIRTDYTVSLKYDEAANAVIALLRIVRINIHFNKLQLVEKELDTARRLLFNQPDVLNQWIDYYDLKAATYEGARDFTDALKYRKLFETAKDSLSNRNNIEDFERMGLGRLMNMHLAQVNQLKTDEKIGYIKRNAVITVLILLVIIFALVYNRRLLEQKKDKELLQAEKRVLDEKLKNSIRDLMLYTESIKQKNELIQKFKDRVKNLQDDKEYAGITEKLMAVNLMTDESWDEFRKLFIKVHARFFIDLRKNFPQISETDLKLLTLMKLQLNNREMANMLSVTVEGIKKAKQRLRKKMALPGGIEEFISGM
jgi:tetratricopeptide (TPR) repeat protein